jgi:hypothetical protein
LCAECLQHARCMQAVPHRLIQQFLSAHCAHCDVQLAAGNMVEALLHISGMRCAACACVAAVCCIVEGSLVCWWRSLRDCCSIGRVPGCICVAVISADRFSAACSRQHSWSAAAHFCCMAAACQLCWRHTFEFFSSCSSIVAVCVACSRAAFLPLLRLLTHAACARCVTPVLCHMLPRCFSGGGVKFSLYFASSAAARSALSLMHAVSRC